MIKKKLLIIGNKPVDNKYNFNEFINSEFNYILRVNRFTNIKETGLRMDGLYVNLIKAWFDLFITENAQYFSNVKDIFLNKNNRNQKLINKLVRNYIIPYNKSVRIIKTNWDHVKMPNEFQTWENDGKTTVPNTTIICIANCIKYFSKFYDIYFTCLDYKNRDEVLKNGEPWKDSHHINVGKYEDEFLTKMINENKLKFIDHDNF